MANNGIFYTSGNTLDFTTTGTTWARLSSGGTFSSLGLSATTYYNLPSTSGLYLPLSGGTVTGDTIFQSGVTITNINNASTDTDTFLVSDSGTIKYRTGSEIASDIGAVTTTGTQTITGTKTFSNSLIASSNSSSEALKVTQLGSGDVVRFEDSNSDTTPFVINTTGNVGIGAEPSTAQVFIVSQTVSWAGLRIKGAVSQTGALLDLVNSSNTSVANIGPTGNFSGNSFIKSGGTSSQFLKADGSVDSNTYITGNQNITLSGDVSGSGTTDIIVTLNDTTVTPGSYTNTNITVDSKGRITSATNGTGGGGAFTGGTVSGATNFTGGLTATTISATTYQNLPFSGTVIGNGTTDTIVKWLNSSEITDSSITDDGVDVTISPNLNVSGNTTLGGTFLLQTQQFFPHGANGFSVNENFDPSNSSTQTAYHFTSGNNARDSVVFSLARTGAFTNMFGISGSASNNRFVIGAETSNTDFEFRTNLGIQPVNLQGGNLLASISRNGDFKSNTISATTYYNLPVSGLTQGTNITITNNNGNYTINSTGGGGTFTGGTVSGATNFTGGLTANTISATTYYNLPQSVSGAGTTNYISKWTGATGLGDSTIYDDGTFIGFNATSPTYGEIVSIQTSNKGITLDGTYIIETGNGSIAIATGYDYGPWGGSGEIAIGTRGPLIDSVGSGNIGIGDRALRANTSGSNNIAIGGTGSLTFNDTGNDNITIGNQSMNQNIDGSDNVSVGSDSLYNNVSGNRNVAIGQQSGYNNGGSSNVFIGRIAGYNHLGSNSIFIGENSGYPDNSQSYILSIGNLIYGSISGRTIGINVTSQTNTLHVSASTNPVRFEGLQSSTDTRYLVSDSNGVVTYRNLPGSSASDCFGTFYTSAISGCSPVTILTPLNATEGLNVTGTTVIQSLSATSFSASTYQGNVVTQITAGSGISVDQSTGNVTITATGGGGGGLTFQQVQMVAFLST